MHDLERLRELFPEPAAPNDEARRRASARLAQALRDEAQAVSKVGDDQSLISRVLRLIRTRPTSSALAFATLVAAAAAAALFLTAPWQNSPGFLAKAQAALTPPPGSVLHMRWESTDHPTSPQQCTVKRGPSEIWIDQTEPHRYRALFFGIDPNQPGDPRAHVCAKSTHYEWGGTLTFGDKAEYALTFVPPNKLWFNTLTFNFPWDPVADIRRAISTGHAHDEGKTQLDGRTVERIRFANFFCPDLTTVCSHATYYYVDPDTFAPVELDGVSNVAPPGVPAVRYRSVTRYLTFEYLPRTPANLALASIRAQHPNATGP